MGEVKEKDLVAAVALVCVSQQSLRTPLLVHFHQYDFQSEPLGEITSHGKSGEKVVAIAYSGAIFELYPKLHECECVREYA